METENIINQKQVFRDKFFKYSLRIGIPIYFLGAGLILYKWSKLPPVVPLLYSLPWGEEQLVNPWALWLLFLGLLVISGINFLLGSFFYKSSVYLAHLLWIASGILSALGIYTIIRIIFLVT
jgi:hypothetical protein